MKLDSAWKNPLAPKAKPHRMFAFAIWDTRKRTLFIARDRLGIKPLYYRLTSESFLFGSEIKVILEDPGVRREFDLAGLPEYLAFGYLSGEDTFYSGIKKLMVSTVKFSLANFRALSPSRCLKPASDKRLATA